MTQEKKERRQYLRFPVMKDLSRPVELVINKTKSTITEMPGILVDLSCGGMGIITFMSVEVGTKIFTKIDLPGLNTNLVEGKIVWCLSKGNCYRLGIAFTKIDKKDFDNRFWPDSYRSSV